MELNDRQRRLAWEAVTMVDRDTLNDNLELIHVNMTTNDEMIELADVLDPDGKFAEEWNNPENMHQVQAAELASEEYWDNKP